MDWYDDEDGRHFPPDTVSSGAFTFTERDGLKCGGFAPDDLTELRKRFRKNAATRRAKDWITAQLRFYAIPFKSSAKVAELDAALEAAIKSGKCKSLPQATALKKKELSEKLQKEHAAYETKLKEWENNTFANLSSPSEEARFDHEKFLAKYFLHDNGDPAPEKHPAALVLSGSNWRESYLAQKARDIHGLRMYSSYMTGLAVIGWQGPAFEKGMDEAFATLSRPGVDTQRIPSMEAFFDIDRFLAKYFLACLKGKPDMQKTTSTIKVRWGSTSPNGASHGPKEQKLGWALCDATKAIPNLCFSQANDYEGTCFVGWGLEKVKTCAREVEAVEREQERKEREAEKARERAEAEAERQRLFGKHWQFSKTYRAPSGPLKLQHITGNYVVRCDVIEKEYCDGDSRISLSIQAPRNDLGTIASFDLYLVEGVMLMALSEDALEQFQRNVETEEKESDYGSEEEPEQDDGENRSKKRKAGGHAGPQPLAIRRRLGETTRPNRVYLRWRGRDPNSGELQVADEDEDHAGYLDFAEDRLTGVGEFCYPEFFGKDQKLKIKIYRQSSTADSLGESWSDLSEERQYRRW